MSIYLEELPPKNQLEPASDCPTNQLIVAPVVGSLSTDPLAEQWLLESSTDN